jgi:hypothetical protein
MLGVRHQQNGLIQHARLSKLQTNEAQAGGEVGREHFECFVRGFDYPVFDHVTAVMGTPGTRVTALSRSGVLSLRRDQASRLKTAMLCDWQPEGQKRDCKNATEKRHAPQTLSLHRFCQLRCAPGLIALRMANGARYSERIPNGCWFEEISSASVAHPSPHFWRAAGLFRETVRTTPRNAAIVCANNVSTVGVTPNQSE